jgi:hypothetical protein
MSIRKCLLSLGAECFVCQYAIQNIKMKINRTIILLVVLHECETWSLILREERRLRMFENWVFEHYIMGRLMICIPHQILFE